MTWQFIAIWLIAGTTVILFLRSEKRRQAGALAARARQFATDPAYRHRGSEPIAPRNLAPVGLSQSDRLFLETLAEMTRKDG